MRDTADTLAFLRDLHQTHATTLPEGGPIKGMCLSVCRQAREITPGLYPDAKTQHFESTQRHDLSLDTVDWATVPRGCVLTFEGDVHWHIATYVGLTKVGPLVWSNDVDATRPGTVAMVKPSWFLTHWGFPLRAWLGDLEGHDLELGAGGSKPAGEHTLARWNPRLNTLRNELLKTRREILNAHPHANAAAAILTDAIVALWNLPPGDQPKAGSLR